MSRAAIVGGGVIGGGWAARFLLNGWDVAVCDPAPGAEDRLKAVLANARRSLPSLYDRALPPEGRLTYCGTLAEAVTGADWVQESVPEQLDLKHRVLAEIEAHAPNAALIGSSTSGFTPTALQEGARRPARILVAHPFNPVYLLPLVEVVPSAATPSDLVARAMETLTSLGMKPLHVRHEIDAHIADRLLESVWREALWLIRDGICTTRELDDAIRYGFGLRWAQMGLFETYRIAGGEDGMAHFMGQFGPALAWPWSRLTDVPDFTPDLVELIAGQSDAQSGHRTIRELERLRDDNLVGILRALRKQGAAAGAVIAAHEATLPAPEPAPLPVTVARAIPQSWTDYNGHMNEAHYLELGAQATDRFMEMIGCDAAYIASGGSYFTVENHLRYLAELMAGDRVTVTTQVLDGAGKKLHLFHRIHGPEGTLAATMETLCLHMDLATRRSAPPPDRIGAALTAFAEAHAACPKPEGAGRHVGQRPRAAP
ncbi:carnitine 3-dehydrogenase [Roseivivax lentus]|uniref:L-carnitine dehydrogenase n=1 Tax=Roseivivax lentus TaxID=633194 RepID=A0A1N7LWX1_9RHOB|nr:carnitine 3-dehydrogenase [Roseivivax lentus]SIS78323.1 carnitine 3-dehydrogenase [Roseivivax lentus]